MTDSVAESFGSAIRQALGAACWYVSVGGSSLPSFSLALGKQMPRETPLKNRAHSGEFRRCEGEFTLLVWCAWRLDSDDSPIASSDDNESTITTSLRLLNGESLQDVSVQAPAWDCVLAFSSGLTLRIFCDHTEKQPSFDGNWEWTSPGVRISTGPGKKYEFNSKDFGDTQLNIK